MANHDMPAAYSALFLAAGPLDWPVLLNRLGPSAADVCRMARLPDAAVDAALAADSDELLEALLHNPQRQFDKSLDARLAETGACVVAEAAFGQRWPTALRRDVLVALRTADPGVPELLRRLLADYFRISRLEYILAAHRLYTAAGPEAVRAAIPGHHRNAVHTAVRDGLDAKDLDAVLAAEQGTPGLLRLLHERRTRDLELYSTVDWTAILSAHAEQPFDDFAVGALVAREDCPRKAVLAFWATHPALVAEKAHTVGPELWHAPTDGRVPPEAIRTLTVRLLATGSRLLDEARPAAPVLEALRGQGDAAAEVRTALSARMAAYGTDVTAWATLRARLEKAEGTVTALLDEVDAQLAVGEVHDGAFPDGARTAFVALLDLAGIDVQLAVSPRLDDRTVHELFTFAAWRPEWIPFAADPRVRRALPHRADLPGEAVDALLGTGEQDLTVLLLAHGHLTERQRDRVLAGPMVPELRTALLSTMDGWRAEDIVSCTDPELRRHIMRHVRIDEFVPQVRLLLGVWEREGAEAAFALLHDNLISFVPAPGPGFFNTSTDVYMRHRAAEDRDVALAQLRGLVAGHGAEATVPPPWDGPAADALRAGVPVAQIFDRAHAARDDEDYSYEGWEQSAVDAGELTWHELIDVGHPASHVAARMVPRPERFDGRARLALSALLDSTLGTNPDAWVLALRLLPDFPGTLPDLLRTAGEMA